jgi:beta-glucosidase
METISLAGLWLLSLGNPQPVIPAPASPLPAVAFADRIELPGTTETRGKGPENEARERGQLTRVRKFEGPAWYQRDIEIPGAWMGKRVQLHLERTKYTQVWLDGHPVGSQVLYTVPQVYDLTSLAKPGKHRLTVMVDNRHERRPVMAEAHQHSDNTQTNWNGILGRIELSATDLLRLEDVQVFPDAARKVFRVRVNIANDTLAASGADLLVRAESTNHAGPPHRAEDVRATVQVQPGAKTIDVDVPLGEAAKWWDEFSPNLYRLTVSLSAGAARDERVVQTGLREFKTRGTQFTINGRTTFLRGKHDGCVFPLTGHPPMDVEGWRAYFRICREYGINHVRCHTWTPPRAAFEAADELGIYLQPELPFWGTFDANVRDGLMPEAERVLREYGNHPSFVMFTLANEAGGERALMNGMVEKLRALDPRRLYADGSNNVLWDPQPQATNEFFTSAKVKTPETGNRAVPVRGSFCVWDGNDGHVQWGPAETRHDLRAAIAGITMPVIAHETGQWTTYPDYREIPRYTGVTRARNLERFRDILARRGLLDQSHEFFRASGRLAALLYKEETELLLRTPGLGGFQHLDLQDFPGQGTALVGVLNAFMEPKGTITAEAWREFCSPVVPLARFDGYTWTTGQTYAADLEVAHFGPAHLADAVTEWRVVDAEGKHFAQGTLPTGTIVQGGLRPLGRVEVPLTDAEAPGKLELVVTVVSGAQRFTNRWPLWVYPGTRDRVPAGDGLEVVRAFDAHAKALLAAGRKVFLVPHGKRWANTVSGAFATDYWCWPMFNNTPGTMGLLCDPAHPALAKFPTSFHSERQWSNLAQASTPVILARTPPNFRPIVQVIDNLERNEKLGLIFEAKAGAGSLLVCAVDLFAQLDRPEVRQLMVSLQEYARSDAFAPKHALDVATLDSLLRPSLAEKQPVKASSFFQPPWGAVPAPEKAVDGDINTTWAATDDDAAPSLAVDLGAPVAIDAIELLWEFNEPGYRYRIESSRDGATWALLSDQAVNAFEGARHYLPVEAKDVRHVRLVLLERPKDRRAGLRDLRVLGVGTYPFQNTSLPIEQRVEDLVSRMTLDEKIACLGTRPHVPRLGVTATGHVEGLHGLAMGGPGGWGRPSVVPTTQFPQAYGLGATWDPELIREVAAAEGYETRYMAQSPKYKRGGLVVRAPNADLGRDPRWGRTEECFGEDAFLTGVIATAFTRGLQGDDPRYWQTASLLKHFLANSNEDGRTGSSSDFDERLLREYYAEPFRRAIVEGGSRAMMAAYNAINGTPATIHPILREIVMREWGLDGIICTDAGALGFMTTDHKYFPSVVEGSAASVKAGINQFLDRYQDGVTQALKTGLLTEADIDEVMKGNFRVMIRLGLLDPAEQVPYARIGVEGEPEPWLSDRHRALARKATQKSIVLLRNENALLPLDKTRVKRVAMIGPRANEVLLDWYSGTPPYTVSPLDGIREKLGTGAAVTCVVDDTDGAAVKAAQTADVAIVCVGNHPTSNAKWEVVTSPSEGKEAVDRKDIVLQAEQEELIRKVHAANPRTVVVLICNFPYAMPWAAKNAPAILHLTHNSQELGHALADALFGDITPGGRLTQTWPASLEQLPPMMDYDLRQGRTYQYFKGEPQYPFGYGLSYTTFRHGPLIASGKQLRTNGSVVVDVEVENTGVRSGDEVVQLYVRYPSSKVERPLKQLKGFQRVPLAPGEKRTVSLELRAAELAYWDVSTKRFVVEPGPVEVQIAKSAADAAVTQRMVIDVVAE